MKIFAKFTDQKKKIIGTMFAIQPDSEYWPDVVEIEDDDPRHIAFLNPPPIVVVSDPLEKLKAFLLANPDVAEILQ